MPKPQSLVPEEFARDAEGRRVCGGLLRDGTSRCRNRAVSPTNGRCRMHSGGAVRGVANPLTRTGRYSTDLPVRVAARYEAALADPELLSVRDDIALLQAAITDVMADMKAAEREPDLDKILGTVERMSAEWQTWDWTRMSSELGALKELIEGRRSQRAVLREVRDLIKEKAALVAQENRLLADREQLITVEQYLLGMTALGSAVARLVDDPAKLRAIDVEFRRLASVPDRGRGA